MDNDYLSFGPGSDKVEEEVQMNEGESENGTDYNIEDILKKAAITLKRQLDKLELFVSP
jgi:hypothetical protein